MESCQVDFLPFRAVRPVGQHSQRCLDIRRWCTWLVRKDAGHGMHPGAVIACDNAARRTGADEGREHLDNVIVVFCGVAHHLF